MEMKAFPSVDKCSSVGRHKQTIVADFDGTLLTSFPYFALVAFEAGGVLRLLFFLLAFPLASLLYHFLSETAGIKLLIFAALCGMKVSEIELVARAVLPKFFSNDLHPESWQVYASCGQRCVLTKYPRIMVEPFLKEYLVVDMVVGTEIAARNGRATGFVGQQGVLVGSKKAEVLRMVLGEERPEIGLGDRITDYPLMSSCTEAHMVPPNPQVEAIRTEDLPKPIIFHDGRLVQKPTPLVVLLTLFWIPIGFLLACIRISVAAILPMSWFYYCYLALGVRITVKGTPPPPAKKSAGRSGVLFVCSHRTCLDPIILSLAAGRSIATVTYSISRLTEILSPIKTFRLTRDRVKDTSIIKRLLEKGDLVICPEGTTCREPFLLRFSAMFAELTDEIVPVAMESGMTMFHGTTARGWKGMDPFYFLMNPSPTYEVTFLDKLSPELTCGAGRSSHEVANYIQRLIGANLSYECTDLTRKDKYLALTGDDGTVKIDEKAKHTLVNLGG